MKAIIYPRLEEQNPIPFDSDMQENISFLLARGFDVILLVHNGKRRTLDIHFVYPVEREGSIHVMVTDRIWEVPDFEELIAFMDDSGISPVEQLQQIINEKMAKTPITTSVHEKFINFLIDNEVLSEFISNVFAEWNFNLELYVERTIETGGYAESLVTNAFEFSQSRQGGEFWINIHKKWIKTLQDA